MTYQHRNKKLSLTDLAEAFKGDYKEIKEVEAQYIAYERYLTALKDDIDAVLDRTFGVMVKDKEFIKEVLSEYIDHESKDFHRVYKQYKVICGMMKPGQKKSPHRITDQDIERARAYPIENLLNFNSRGKMKCIFDLKEENTASLHKYGNAVWCFGCQTRADSIAVYMHQTGDGFIDAVKKLSKS